MKIGITGGSGLVGSHLCEKLKLELNADILSVPRKLLYGNVEELASYISGCEVIIHLSGASIISRWTSKRKRILRDSRILTTRNLSSAIGLLEKKPKIFISTSAVGIYDTSHTHIESSADLSIDFLGQLCLDWEQAANEAEKHGVRTIIFRLGVVLSNKGGVLAKVLPIFRLALGGKLGSGKQAFPFIHINDLVNAYLHVITKTGSGGIYNLVSPELVTNNDFTKELSSFVNRPAIFSVPSIILKFIYGEGARVLLTGQKVAPERLLNEGFCFYVLTLNETLFSFK